MKEDEPKFYIFEDEIGHRTVIVARTEKEAKELTKSIYGQEPNLVEVAAIKEPFICEERYFVKDI